MFMPAAIIYFLICFQEIPRCQTARRHLLSKISQCKRLIMQTAIRTVVRNFCGPQIHRVAAALGLVLMLGSAQTASAQTSNQLTLSNNYFVTGDYVVGGVGLRGLGVNGVATGTIAIPDPKQPNSTSVPAGADIVAAFLYWETVEGSQVVFAGKNGFFNGYPISGDILGDPNAPTSWSSGGWSGSAQGSKTMRVYRADVRPYLNLDANGNILGNGSYPVRLADSGSNGGGIPLTLSEG